MNLNQMLIHDEGLELKPYKCTGDKLTIGVGRNLEDTGISEAEALFLLQNDIDRIHRAMAGNATFNRLDEVRQMAVVNMCFQLGVAGCLSFRKMWAALEAGDYQLAHDEALDSRWHRQTPNRARRVANVLLTGDMRAYE